MMGINQTNNLDKTECYVLKDIYDIQNSRMLQTVASGVFTEQSCSEQALWFIYIQ